MKDHNILLLAARSYAIHSEFFYGLDEFTKDSECIRYFNNLSDRDQAIWKTIVYDIIDEVQD